MSRVDRLAAADREVNCSRTRYKSCLMVDCVWFVWRIIWKPSPVAIVLGPLAFLKHPNGFSTCVGFLPLCFLIKCPWYLLFSVCSFGLGLLGFHFKLDIWPVGYEPFQLGLVKVHYRDFYEWSCMLARLDFEIFGGIVILKKLCIPVYEIFSYQWVKLV